MGTLLRVSAVGVAVGGAAAAVIAVLLVRRAVLRRRAVPAALVRLAHAIPDALGDAALAIDPAGRIVFANSAAARLAGAPIADLVDRALDEVAPELAALARGVERAPAVARITLHGPRGPVAVTAALVWVLTRPPVAFAVMRVVPRLRPPPLPPAPPVRPDPDRDGARAGLDAAAAALREPVAAAADALSMLRLAASRLAPSADAALAAAEEAVEAAMRRVSEIGAAGARGGARRPIDVAALVEDVVATFPAPAGVRLHADVAASRALADDRPVRAAVRELLGAAAGSLPAGGEIEVAARGTEGAALIEIRSRARPAAGDLALARALVAPQGGRVDDEQEPGRGWVVRVALEAAAALEPA